MYNFIKICSLIGCLLFFINCGGNQNKPSISDNFFGEEFPIDLSTDLNLKTVTDKTDIQIEGEVVSVCQKKGCWMKVVPENSDKDTIHVTFKDYGFFMPLDLAGHKVTINGVAFENITSVAELKHYAEDANASDAEIESIVAPKKEIRIEASGVKIKKDIH